MIEDASGKQTKALQILNTDQQSKSIDYLFSKNIVTIKAEDKLEKLKI